MRSFIVRSPPPLLATPSASAEGGKPRALGVQFADAGGFCLSASLSRANRALGLEPMIHRFCRSRCRRAAAPIGRHSAQPLRAADRTRISTAARAWQAQREASAGQVQCQVQCAPHPDRGSQGAISPPAKLSRHRRRGRLLTAVAASGRAAGHECAPRHGKPRMLAGQQAMAVLIQRSSPRVSLAAA